MSSPIATQTQSRSLVIAYVLWFFFGGIGAHRFYLGHTRSGLYMLGLCILSVVLSLVVIGALGFLVLGIWWLVDAFLMPGLARTAPAP